MSVLNDSSTCFNQDPKGISGLQWIYIVLLLLLMLLIWLENGLILAVFVRSPRLRTATNFYICQLATADFSVGLTLVYQVAIFFKRQIVHNHYACALRYVCAMTLSAVSMFALLVMTYDRYSAIKNPLTYHSSLSPWRYLVSTVIIWSPPVVICFILPLIWHNYCPSECDFILSMKLEYLQFLLVPTFPILCSIQIVLYIRIFSMARAQVRKIQMIATDLNTSRDTSTENTTKSSGAHRGQMRLVKTAIVIFSTFYIFWTPFFLSTAIQAYTGQLDSGILNTIRSLAIILAGANSAVNPLIYTLKMKAFKIEIMKIFGKTIVEAYDEPTTQTVPAWTPGIHSCIKMHVDIFMSPFHEQTCTKKAFGLINWTWKRHGGPESLSRLSELDTKTNKIRTVIYWTKNKQTYPSKFIFQTVVIGYLHFSTKK